MSKLLLFILLPISIYANDLINLHCYKVLDESTLYCVTERGDTLIVNRCKPQDFFTVENARVYNKNKELFEGKRITVKVTQLHAGYFVYTNEISTRQPGSLIVWTSASDDTVTFWKELRHYINVDLSKISDLN